MVGADEVEVWQQNAELAQPLNRNWHLERPILTEQENPAEYLRVMLDYRRSIEPDFSIKSAVKTLRRVSPALVTLIIKGQRRITLDRVEELAKLMKLTANEKFTFRNWIATDLNIVDEQEPVEEPAPANGEMALPISTTVSCVAPVVPTHEKTSPKSQSKKPKTNEHAREASLSLLNDWLNVYVKDLLSIPKYQKAPHLIQGNLKGLATPVRIEKAIQFLHREGYIRRRADGSWVLDTPLVVTEPKDAQAKVRRFHKAGLAIASRNLEIFGPKERLANTMTVPLNDETYEELRNLISDFAEELKDFATRNRDRGNRLYQVVLNLSPIGAKQEGGAKDV